MRTYYDIQLNDRTIAKRELEGEAIVKAGRYLIAKTLLELGAATVDPLSPAEPAHLLRRPVRRHELLQRQPHERRLQEPADRRRQGGERRRHLQLRPRPAQDRRLHAARRLAGLGGDPLQEGRQHRISTTPRRTWARATSRRNEHAARQVRQEGHDRALRPGRRVPGPAARHRLQRQGRPARAAGGARRRRRGDGIEEGQGHRGGPRQDADLPRAQEGQRQHQGLRQDAAGRRHRARTSTPRSAPWAWPTCRTRWAACRCATSAPAGWPTSPRARSSRWAATTSASSTPRAAASRRTPACPAASSSAATSTTTRAARKWSRRSSTRRSACSAPTAASRDPDDLAQLNYVANDLGVDTIELGATLAVLMEAGLGAFGDVKFMTDCLVEIRKGTEKGRLWAQGTARVGEHYKVRRVPVIKKQAISAYDPRVVEATGISMMATAQGADHTAGNLPRLKTREMDLESLVSQSLAAPDARRRQRLARSLHLRHERDQSEHRVADQRHQRRSRHEPDAGLLRGARAATRSASRRSSTARRASPRRTTSCRRSSTTEALPPTNHVARFHGADVHRMYERLPA